MVFLIVVLALGLLAIVFAPLFSKQLIDDLPDMRDPVTVDLEEERDALLRAIRELDARIDLSEERRVQLRTRYEAKAAQVLKRLDERQQEVITRNPAATGTPVRRRIPWGAAILAGSFVVVAAAMAGWVLPRVGQATVTAFFEADVQAAQQLQELMRAVDSDPSPANLLALGDAYWQLNDPDGAFGVYQRLAEASEDPPAIALKRLGILTLDIDMTAAVRLLERAAAADPDDPETLYFLAEYYFATGELSQALVTWRSYLALPDMGSDPEASARVSLIEEIAPLVEQVEDGAPVEVFEALGDAFWRHDERVMAVDVYFRILTELDPLHGMSLSRLGQMLFLEGRLEEAALFLAQAANEGVTEPEGLLFLGNALFSLEDYESAASAWTRYVFVVGEEEAGRVPGLIDEARARASGLEPTQVVDFGVDSQSPGEAVFTANCSMCHGPTGRGGIGPSLVANPRSADEALVSNTVRFGRGNMPAFMAVLDADEIADVVAYVVNELAADE